MVLLVEWVFYLFIVSDPRTISKAYDPVCHAVWIYKLSVTKDHVFRSENFVETDDQSKREKGEISWANVQTMLKRAKLNKMKGIVLNRLNNEGNNEGNNAKMKGIID